MAIETKPGFILKSLSHEIKFVTAFQLGSYSPRLENNTDWSELMRIVGKGFDSCDDLDTIKAIIVQEVIDWLRLTELNQQIAYKLEVSIEEREYFENFFGGRKKAVEINFKDSYKTQLSFYVTRMKSKQVGTLKQIACEAVTDALENDEDINDLEVPKTIIDDLYEQVNNQWTMRWKKKALKLKNELMNKLISKIKKERSMKKRLSQGLKNLTFSCQVCGLKTKSKGGLTRHKNAKH